MRSTGIPFVVRELVLAGGGHAHLGVLRGLAKGGPPPGTRVTLVAREPEALYSGMLPGLIGGRFTPDECKLDLPRLARAAGARFIAADVAGLDRQAGKLVLGSDRPPLRYDLLSLNLGSAPALVPGAAEYAIPIRPFDRFLAAWEALLARTIAAPRGLRLLVVGAGAAGVEVVLALRRRLGSRVMLGLLGRAEAPLPRASPTARRAVTHALNEAGIVFHAGAEAVRVLPNVMLCADGRRVGFDEAIWATGAAPLPWLRGSDLALCPRGFVAVNGALRSLNDERVFAVGDCATVQAQERERAGVYAVRQGPPLHANLRRVLAGKAPRPFRMQRRYLALLATGATRALAMRGRLAAEGNWALRLKDRIDRRWIAMHVAMTPMLHTPSALAPMRCGGCGAKLPAQVLAEALAGLPRAPAMGDVPLGLSTPDDAALLRPPSVPGRLLVQTVDMFRAFTDDLFLFGRIAATHALGDIAAMGAEPRAAMAVVALPPAAEALMVADLQAMLVGAQQVLAEAGACLVGGHSAEGLEPMLGFSLTGEVEESRALRRSGLRAGDLLVLTKPIGTGALLAGAMTGGVAARHLRGALAAMQLSPFPAARTLLAYGATACVDVTGFGLLNHLAEMAEASGVAVSLDPLAVPALAGALETIVAGTLSTLHPGNAAAALPRQGNGWEAVAPERLALLLDPQTAGGLLCGIPPDRAGACVKALRATGCPEAAVIGEVRAGRPRVDAQPVCIAWR